MAKKVGLGLERRKFPRFKDDIFILCSLLPDSKEFEAVTSNISANGLMFETEEDILPGNKIAIEIYQPINKNKDIIISMSVLARVAWAKEIQKDKFEQGENKYRLGIQFEEIEGKSMQLISDYVEKNVLER